MTPFRACKRCRICTIFSVVSQIISGPDMRFSRVLLRSPRMIKVSPSMGMWTTFSSQHEMLAMILGYHIIPMTSRETTKFNRHEINLERNIPVDDVRGLDEMSCHSESLLSSYGLVVFLLDTNFCNALSLHRHDKSLILVGFPPRYLLLWDIPICSFKPADETNSPFRTFEIERLAVHKLCVANTFLAYRSFSLWVFICDSSKGLSGGGVVDLTGDGRPYDDGGE
ncbi:hypothetical protein Tco_1068556 [Tanacetum coccineum]|uniref:Uncharacterized protein n=1 Tax=Tanacetum coccineum TaxID=301880 RepID=A0ABQ5HGX4_9ASTR